MEENNLHCHALFGRYFEVQSLVNEGVDSDGKNSDGQTPLMLAAQGSQREVFDLLVNSGADIHCCDDKGSTVLHYASCGGSVEIVQSLVNKGVALDTKDSYGRTPFMIAVRSTHIEVLRLLINSGADMHCCDGSGWTALHYAANNGSLQIVHGLLFKKVSPNCKNSRGRTPLMLAASKLDIEIVIRLVGFKADIHICDDDGWTLLHYASFVGLFDVVKFHIGKRVSDVRVNLDIKTSDGRTPLMLALGKAHGEVAKLLINGGANVLCRDDHGWTMLHFASCGGLREITHLLVVKGVSTDLKNSRGQTPLQLAFSMRKMDVVAVLTKIEELLIKHRMATLDQWVVNDALKPTIN